MGVKKIEIDQTKCSGCWSCRMICSLTFQKRFNPLESFIKIEWNDQDGYSIIFDEDCTDCTMCAKYCSFGALTIKER
jgi:Fe-S-cluster-containing hydrogenase component 2